MQCREDLVRPIALAIPAIVNQADELRQTPVVARCEEALEPRRDRACRSDCIALICQIGVEAIAGKVDAACQGARLKRLDELRQRPIVFKTARAQRGNQPAATLQAREFIPGCPPHQAIYESLNSRGGDRRFLDYQRLGSKLGPTRLSKERTRVGQAQKRRVVA
ncbi:hypothetical protein ASF22_18795 [Methylobacterium sp. Leaf87]|nr:hypothetical protein ASF22_18795 [Methylobacterium sp. Leaf87]